MVKIFIQDILGSFDRHAFHGIEKFVDAELPTGSICDIIFFITAIIIFFKKIIQRNFISFLKTRSKDVIVITEQDVELFGDNPSLIIRPAFSEGKELYAS